MCQRGGSAREEGIQGHRDTKGVLENPGSTGTVCPRRETGAEQPKKTCALWGQDR